ncbi:MAG: YdcF family protein [Verrucomicrobia bacterium]|nr:YdcF family protein [Verrucomicrobiota bacterium]
MVSRARKRRRPWWRALILGLVCVLLVFVALAIDMCVYPSRSVDGKADVAVVLGAAVWDGAPSPVFQARIDHAIGLYKAGDVKALVFTGGVGDGDLLAEAEVAKAYAVEHGVPADHIRCETASRITCGNLEGARAILDAEGWRTELIVSDPLHMRRSVMMARDVGIDAYPSPTPTSRYASVGSKAGFLVREVRMYAIYLVERLFL